MSNRICHVTSVHPATDARIFWKECISLSKKYEVCLIANNTKEREEHGIKIYNVDLPKSRVKRFFCLNRVLKKMLEVDADVYHLHDPELMKIGIKIKKYGKKIVFDSHEDVPMQILCKDYLPLWSRKRISLLYTCYEKRMLRKYDTLISVTPTIVERLKKINPSTYMITNYPVLDEFPNYIESIGSNEKINICFAGGVSRRYMHENIIKALSKTNANYVLAGPAYPGYMNNLESLEGWKKVSYVGIVSHEEVYKIYKNSLAGIVLLDYTANVGYHRGTLGVLKLFEYMMVGIPVIATDFELWKEIVNSSDCGICVNPHNIDAIANAINFYINNPEQAKEKGRNGRNAVIEKYNWESQEKILFELYEKVLEQ